MQTDEDDCAGPQYLVHVGGGALGVVGTGTDTDTT